MVNALITLESPWTGNSAFSRLAAYAIAFIFKRVSQRQLFVSVVARSRETVQNDSLYAIVLFGMKKKKRTKRDCVRANTD